MFKVGDEVVLFVGETVCHCNSEYSPEHPCRGKILKVGKLYYHIQVTGAPVKIAIDGAETHKGWNIQTIENGKAKYRAFMERFKGEDDSAYAAHIDHCVDNL